MLFPLTFKFLKPLQNHMQKVISLCGCVTAGRDVLIAQQLTWDISALSKCTKPQIPGKHSAELLDFPLTKQTIAKWHLYKVSKSKCRI